MSEMRLQRYLAEAGVASRRKAEELILEGVVAVNGVTVKKLGTKVTVPPDKVSVRGKPIAVEKKSYYLFHKPRGVVTTMGDNLGRKSVFDFTKNLPTRVYPVGRLDQDASGLLLLTNDGEYADALLHPRNGVEKVYLAIVSGKIADRTVKMLLSGVELKDGMGVATRIRRMRESPRMRQLLGPLRPGQAYVEVTVAEGRNHFVKRLMAEVGHPVHRLMRTAFGPYELGSLGPGRITTTTLR